MKRKNCGEHEQPPVKKRVTFAPCVRLVSKRKIEVDADVEELTRSVRKKLRVSLPEETQANVVAPRRFQYGVDCAHYSDPDSVSLQDALGNTVGDIDYF
jgi:hypothetical protein